MFWKISKENHEAALQRISSYLLSVFEFAAKSEKNVFEKEEWLDFSPGDGAWFWKLYAKKAENGARMRQAVNALFTLERAQRERIYKAIAHDMRFEEDLSSPFVFQSTKLKEEEQKLLKDFFLYFYEVVLCESHFRLGDPEEPFGRKELAEAYFEGENRAIGQVCPVCLQSMTSARDEAEVEHYFGKAFVPCLALHPGNLYFSCPTCNKIYKGEKKPLYRQHPDIRKSFLPYVDTVKDKALLEFVHDKERDKVQLKPLDPEETYIEEKLEVFEDLFRLGERWPKSLPRYYQTLRAKFKALSEDALDRPEEMQKEMLRYLKMEQADLENRPENYLEAQYMNWVCGSQWKAFYAEMTQKERGRG